MMHVDKEALLHTLVRRSRTERRKVPATVASTSRRWSRSESTARAWSEGEAV